MGLNNEIIPELFITNSVAYNNRYNVTDGSFYGRYKPFKDVIRYEEWFCNGSFNADWTNINNWEWYRFYYARRHQNLPNDENLYELQFISYGASTQTYWAFYKRDYTR